MIMPFFLRNHLAPKRGWVSVSLQHFSHEALVGVTNRLLVYQGICTTHSNSRKNDFFIETGWNVTLFSRSFAVPPSDQKKKM